MRIKFLRWRANAQNRHKCSNIDLKLVIWTFLRKIHLLFRTYGLRRYGCLFEGIGVEVLAIRSGGKADLHLQAAIGQVSGRDAPAI